MDVNLVLFMSNGKRKSFPLVNANTLIGRASDCHLRIPMLSVSRRHCEVRVDGNEVLVKDLASSNGTYVNNQRVKESSVRPGDRVAIGPMVFTVQVNGQPYEIKPVKTRGQKSAEKTHAAIKATRAKNAQRVPAPRKAAAEPNIMDPLAELDAIARDRQ